MVRIIISYAALLLLLAATVGASFIPLGQFNFYIGMGISLLKTAIIGLVFMQLFRNQNLLRITAVAGIVWLSILFILSFSDYGFRSLEDENIYMQPPAQ